MSMFLRAVVPICFVVMAALPLAAQEQGRYGHYEVHDPDLPPRAEYAARRARVLERLDSNSAMLVRSNEPRTRSNDVNYEFRQRNNFLYLTGVNEPESAVLLTLRPIMIDGKPVNEILFVAKRKPGQEVWTGIRMGPEVAPQVTGMKTVLPYDELNDVLSSFLPTIGTLYYDGWVRPGYEIENLVAKPSQWEREQRSGIGAKYPDLTIKHAGQILNKLRVIKSPVEIALLRKAVDISVESHRATIRQARPTMHEYELEAIMEYNFHRLGAEEPGYPSIVGSGPHSCILHYETSRRKTKDGDMIVMDCGAEYHGYTSDVTRTIPINGRFSEAQRALYDLVLEAQTAGIEACRVGKSFHAAHLAAMGVISDGMVKLGIIRTGAEASQYFMHGTSHFIGLDVHDVGPMGSLQEGMVMTVEPGIYIPEGSDCDPKWWNIGIRIEDDILITKDGPVNLSGALERTADEIERLMNGPESAAQTGVKKD